jgi:hypothetical protein
MEYRILDKTGDTKVIFDKNVPEEVEAAEAQFAALIEKGFKAFLVKKDGTPGRQIKTFNPTAERYIFVPALVGG